MGESIISLEGRRSQQRPLRRVFLCIECGSFQFKLIEVDGENLIGCANCEAWINEFDLVAREGFDP